MTRAALTVALLLFAATAEARVDPVLVRDIICEAETRGERMPGWAIGRIDPGDWGLCQIQYESAWRYGAFDPVMKRSRGRIKGRSPGDLFVIETNRAVALHIVEVCVLWYPRGDARRIFYCYSAGFNSVPGTDARKWKESQRRASIYAQRNRIRLAER